MNCRGLAVGVMLSVAHLSAQSPTFGVASIKVSPPIAPGGVRVITGSAQPGGRWLSQNAPFIDILRNVYPEHRLRGQITGGPDWMTRTRFDIDARAEGSPTRAQMVEMMKQLLAERFSLKLHAEQRGIDVYALTVARRDRRLNAGLRPSTVDCDAVAAARAKGESPVGPRGRPLCIALSAEQPNGTLRVSGSGALMTHLVSMIQGAVREPIVDRTGLTGRYDLDLEFNPEVGSLRAGAFDGPGSSIFTAVQEQLGLRLDLQRAQMDVLVIDHVEMPTPD
jgi:uncharacterized protein (TIGR03435 family)